MLCVTARTSIPKLGMRQRGYQRRCMQCSGKLHDGSNAQALERPVSEAEQGRDRTLRGLGTKPTHPSHTRFVFPIILRIAC